MNLDAKVNEIIQILKNLSGKYKELRNYAKYLDLLLSDFISRALRVLEVINEHLTRLEGEIELLKTKQIQVSQVPKKKVAEEQKVVQVPKVPQQALIPFPSQVPQKSVDTQITKKPSVQRMQIEQQKIEQVPQIPIREVPVAQRTDIQTQKPTMPHSQTDQARLTESTQLTSITQSQMQPQPTRQSTRRADVRLEMLSQLKEHLKSRAKIAKKLA